MDFMAKFLARYQQKILSRPSPNQKNLDCEIETPKTQLVTVIISLAVAVGLNAIAIITTIEKGE